jgi:uncharacterized delta-60 repeat protein
MGSAWTAEVQTEFKAFTEWTQRYLAAADHEGLVKEGLQLAAIRREAMVKMIRTNPERALALAVPFMVRKKLPEEVVSMLETRVSGTGELALHAATPAPGQKVDQAMFRSALIDGTEYSAFTYGRRTLQTTLPQASIIGVALDGSLAVSESPVRVLEAGETPDGRPILEVCPVSGNKTPLTSNAPLNLAANTAVEANGVINVLCQSQHLPKFEASLIQNEITAGNNQPGTSGVVGRPTVTWAQGTKKVLIIRVDFSDKTGVPVNPTDSQSMTEDYIVNRFNSTNGVSAFYQQCSYGKTALTISPTVSGDSPDVTGVLRMPSTAASYATAGNNSLLHSDARAAAIAAGFAVDSYDRIGVVFANLGSIASSKITYGGLGDVIGTHFWINGYFDFSVVAHEIGHNYGLNHANLWKVTDSNPVSAAGTSTEYGDTFDIMGGGSTIEHQFSHWNKSMLQWIPDSSVTTISSGGTYRVYRFDHPSASFSNALALKIVRNRTQDYWIGNRRATTNASLNNGAYILWGYNDNEQGNLLDMTTPGVATTHDEALAIGTTFTDSVAGITIKPLASGGTGGADQWLDVQVTLQPRIAWTLGTYYVDEQNGSATLTLTRTGNSVGAISVNYATAPGTATSPADFTASSGTINWANGDSANKTITIPIVADSVVEGTENFTVTLSNPSGAVIVDNTSATVTIADAGAKDPTFASDFINSQVNKVIVNPDGSMILGGWFSQVQDSSFNLYTRVGLTSVGSTGALDATFANGGGVSGGTFNVVYDLARQSDGKILAVGDYTAVHGIGRNRIARLNTDGTLDTSFNPGTGANGTIYAVLVQPDGKILIGGAFTSYNGTAREYLARLNANGTLDTTFVGPDFAETTNWWVQCLALQPDGKLLVGGEFYFTGANFKAGICRVTTTGALDAAFNGVFQGSVTTSGNTIKPIDRIVLQSDAQILIAGGFIQYNGTARGGLARLTSTGALESTSTFAAPTSNGECHAVFVQPDGKILVGGTFTTFNGTTANKLARLSSSGALDTAFVTAGGTNASGLENFALQADGKIVFCGDFGSFQGSAATNPIWRLFPGLPGLPGTIQFATEQTTAIEGTSTTLSVTRVGGTQGAMSVNYSTVIGTASTADFTTSSGTLSWTNGDSATKTITIPITADAIAEGTETFTANLGEATVGGVVLGKTQQTSVSIMSSFGAWAASYFTPLELANSAISGDNADPDNDGINNLLEFALNLNPRVVNASGLPAATVQNVGGSNYLTLTFKRRVPLLDLAYSVTTNTGLTGTWTANAVQVGSAISNGDGTETVTYRDAVPVNQVGTTRRFMRLEVTRTP